MALAMFVLVVLTILFGIVAYHTEAGTAPSDDDVPAAGIVVLVLLTALGILVAINFALSV